LNKQLQTFDKGSVILLGGWARG